MILLGIILFFTVLEAVHEGLALRGRRTGKTIYKKIAAGIEFIKLMGIPALVLFWPWLIRSDMYLEDYYINPHTNHFWRTLFVHLILGWTFIRFGIFNPILNLVAGLSIMHIGTVKLLDRLEKWIFRNQLPGPSFFIPRILLLAAGISLIFRI